MSWPRIYGELQFEIVGRHLHIWPTGDGVLQARELLSPDDRLWDMLENAVGNGWANIPPGDIGAMTDAPILSEDATLEDDGYWTVPSDGRVYGFMNYCVEDPVETWAEGRKTVWRGV